MCRVRSGALNEQINRVNRPGELLEGAEGNHGAHSLTGWSEGGVQEYITNTGHMDHAVVVQVRGERHSESTAQTHKQKDLLLTQLQIHNFSNVVDHRRRPNHHHNTSV